MGGFSLVVSESLASVDTGVYCPLVVKGPLAFNSTSKTLQLFIYIFLNVKKKKSPIHKYILNFLRRFPILYIILSTQPTPKNPKIISK